MAIPRLGLARRNPAGFYLGELLAPAGEPSCTVHGDLDEALVKFTPVVIRDLFAVLKSAREAGDDGERWIRRRAGLVDRKVGELVHFYERFGNGETVMVLEEIRILDSVSFDRANEDGGNNGNGVVRRVVVVARELDGQAWRIWLREIPMAMAVQVGHDASIIMYPGGPRVGWKAGKVSYAIEDSIGYHVSYAIEDRIG